MKFQRQIERLTAQQASEWIEVLQRGGAAERAAFVAWLKESRRHVEEFLAMVAVDRELGSIDAARAHDLDALLKKVVPGISRALPERASRFTDPRVQRRRNRSVWGAGLAAGIVALVFAAWMLRDAWYQGNRYETATGEQRVVELADGSLVYLNTRSEIRIELDDTARNVRLVRGEALFKVAADPQRPFRVQADDIVVQAVGTQFNVYARPDGALVSVVEGKVRVASSSPEPSLVSAGEEVKVATNGQMQRLPQRDIQKMTAWRERRLVFREDTLEHMAEEFNRYNVRPRFHLEGELIRQRHYSGTFDADDPQSLAELLSRERGVAVQITADEIRVRPAHQPVSTPF
jgi:transmembrane sensor